MVHIEFFLEEESCAEAIRLLTPKIVGDRATFDMHVFQGKSNLLSSLPQRLQGYAKWLPSDRRIVVLVDRDNDDGLRLKKNLEDTAQGRACHPIFIQEQDAVSGSQSNRH